MEIAWLLDDGRLCVGAGCRGLTMVGYCDDRAIRFARREDAERMRQIFARLGLALTASHVHPVEHGWGFAPLPHECDA